jgi:hypothetical protein
MTVIARRSINRREEFRVEIVTHPGGNTVILVGRSKTDAAGQMRPAGDAVAFDVSRMRDFAEVVLEASASIAKGERA